MKMISPWPGFVDDKLRVLEADAEAAQAEAAKLEQRRAELLDFLNQRRQLPDAPQSGLAFDRYFRERQEEFKAVAGKQGVDGRLHGGKLEQAQRLRDRTERALASCQHWLEQLPDEAVIEQVHVKVPKGATLERVRRDIEQAEAELKAIRSAPVPGPDIEGRIRQYIGKLAVVEVRGIGEGERLEITWADPLRILAALFPDAMVKAAMRTVEQMAQKPLPVSKRPSRIAELKQEIEELQHLEEALVLAGNRERLPDAAPAAVLGCRVVTARRREKAA